MFLLSYVVMELYGLYYSNFWNGERKMVIFIRCLMYKWTIWAGAQYTRHVVNYKLVKVTNIGDVRDEKCSLQVHKFPSTPAHRSLRHPNQQPFLHSLPSNCVEVTLHDCEKIKSFEDRRCYVTWVQTTSVVSIVTKKRTKFDFDQVLDRILNKVWSLETKKFPFLFKN